MSTNQNPLSQFFRQFKLYTRLASNPNRYTDDVIKFTDSGEVGILPMTGKDELILKNPDALLNGEALVEVIKSCVPAVKNPKLLLNNDINVLITAIRQATYGSNLESEMNCPNCGFEGKLSVDLQYALDTMTHLEDEYVVNLDNGLSVFISPYYFTDMVAGLRAQFEREKLVRLLKSDEYTEDQKTSIIGKAFSELAKTKVELTASAISKIVNESVNLSVSDKNYIKEFLQNIDISSLELISHMIETVNQVGIKKTIDTVCPNCNHKWDSEIDYNPVNFS